MQKRNDIELINTMPPNFLVNSFEIVSAADFEENLLLYFHEKRKHQKEFYTDFL